jgi:hypothetical protein
MQVPDAGLPTESSCPGLDVCVFLSLFMQILAHYVKLDHDLFCPTCFLIHSSQITLVADII